MKSYHALLLVSSLSFTQIYAQTITAEGRINSGFENNIFHSPESYLDRVGTLYDKNDLIVSDGLVEFNWELGYKTTIKKNHKIRIEGSGETKNYFSTPLANTAQIMLQGKYKYVMSDKLKLGYNLELERSKKLITNILGNELPALFTFTQFINEVFAQYEIIENNETTLGAYHKIRKYESAPNTESLSYNTPALFFSTEQKFNINKVETKLDFEIEIKERKYTERTAKDANGNSQVGYPKRDWSYFVSGLSYNIEFSNGIEFEPFLAYTKRTDKFQDQFSYKELGYGLKFEYSLNHIVIDLRSSINNKNYNIRPALQTDGTEIPLSYKYFKLSAEGEYSLSKRISFFVLTDYVSRDSNVTSIEKRPRRGFKTFNILGGIQYTFEKDLKSK